MKESKIFEKENYPGWPKNYDWPTLDEWERAINPTKLPLGQGLFCSDIGLPETDCCPPHPEYVKKWRKDRGETVKNTARYFALTDVQVLEACR